MEIKIQYSGLEDRQSKIAENEAKGLRMLHDNFIEGWKHGDLVSGIMIFTNEPLISIQPEPMRDLAKEIDTLKARIESLESAKLAI